MNRVALVIIAALAVVGFAPMPAVLHAQEPLPQVILLDKNGAPVSGLTDGDLIKLRIKTGRAAQPMRVPFALDDGTALAECALARGAESCETERFNSLGWAWDRNGQLVQERSVGAQLDGGMSATTRVRVAPRPVVMAHGFLSSAEAWKTWLGPQGFLASAGLRGFAVGDGQVEGAFNTGNIANPNGRTNTIAQNADVLARVITQVKQQTGAQQVDLIGHSMGGLISRYYIDRLMHERDVAQLIMLGTPHNGSDCANLPAALNMYLPASLEIRPSYARGIFNPQITRRRGVPFYELAGTSILEPVKSPCTNVPTDIAVSLDSAQGISLSLSTLPLLHIDLNASRQAFDEFVKPRLQTPAGGFPIAPDPLSLPAAQPDLQFTRIFTGHVAAGGSQEVTVNIDQVSVASFALYDPTRSLTVTVRGASGNVIALDAARNGLIVVDDPATLVYLGYGFQNPRPGPWRITLLATDKTPPAGIDYALTAQLRGGAVLQARTSALVTQPGALVEVAARLELAGQPVPIQTAAARLQYPDGSQAALTLSPAGDEWRAAWQPTLPGLYGVNVAVQSAAPDGTPLEREAFLAMQVQSPAESTRVNPLVFVGLGVIVLIVIAALAAFMLVGFMLLRRRSR